jgi:hypothetical protein
MPRGEDEGRHHAGRRSDRAADIIRIWQDYWLVALFNKRHVVSGRIVGAPLAGLGEFQNTRQRDEIPLDGRVGYTIGDPTFDDLADNNAVNLVEVEADRKMAPIL